MAERVIDVEPEPPEDGRGRRPPSGEGKATAEAVLRLWADIDRKVTIAVHLLADIHSVVVHGRKPVTPAAPPNPQATVSPTPEALAAIARAAGPIAEWFGFRLPRRR